jgi:hypothetical protein
VSLRTRSRPPRSFDDGDFWRLAPRRLGSDPKDTCLGLDDMLAAIPVVTTSVPAEAKTVRLHRMAPIWGCLLEGGGTTSRFAEPQETHEGGPSLTLPCASPPKARRRIGLLPVALRQRHGRRMTETEPLAPFHRRLRSGDIHTPYDTGPTQIAGRAAGGALGGAAHGAAAAARALDARACGGWGEALGEAPKLAPSD